MTQRDGTGREVEEGAGWGTRVHPWRMHVDVWPNQYDIIKVSEEEKRKGLRKYLKRLVENLLNMRKEIAT